MIRISIRDEIPAIDTGAKGDFSGIELAKEVAMSLSEILDLTKKSGDRHYYQDIESGDDVKDWSVYQNVMKYVDYAKSHGLKNLPPFQFRIREDNKPHLEDGNHRLAMLSIMAKENPQLLNQKFKVQFYK